MLSSNASLQDVYRTASATHVLCQKKYTLEHNENYVIKLDVNFKWQENK